MKVRNSSFKIPKSTQVAFTACRAEESEKRVVGKSEGIAWVVSTARRDKRTGFVGKPVRCSRYVHNGYLAVMRKWGEE